LQCSTVTVPRFDIESEYKEYRICLLNLQLRKVLEESSSCFVIEVRLWSDLNALQIV